VAPPSARPEALWELRLVDTSPDVEALTGATVFDSQRLGRNLREGLCISGVPLTEGGVGPGRIERGDELGAKADVDELSGHVSTLIPRLR
jgi:hypothetical protein